MLDHPPTPESAGPTPAFRSHPAHAAIAAMLRGLLLLPLFRFEPRLAPTNTAGPIVVAWMLVAVCAIAGMPALEPTRVEALVLALVVHAIAEWVKDGPPAMHKAIRATLFIAAMSCVASACISAGLFWMLSSSPASGVASGVVASTTQHATSGAAPGGPGREELYALASVIGSVMEMIYALAAITAFNEDLRNRLKKS